MIKVLPPRHPDASRSFELYLDSTGRSRTVREMDWVEDTPQLVDTSLTFTYKQFHGNYHESEIELKLTINGNIMDFHKGYCTNENDDFPTSLLSFEVLPTGIKLRGTWNPGLALWRYGGDIVFFDCQFNYSFPQDSEWPQKFYNFKGKTSYEPLKIIGF
jgi:hypothetical protein